MPKLRLVIVAHFGFLLFVLTGCGQNVPAQGNAAGSPVQAGPVPAAPASSTQAPAANDGPKVGLFGHLDITPGLSFDQLFQLEMGNITQFSKVVLVKPASDTGQAFSAGEQCEIGYGGTLKLLDAAGMVYQYNFPLTAKRTYCPDGSQVQLNPASYQSATGGDITAINQLFDEQLKFMNQLGMPAETAKLPQVQYLPAIPGMTKTVELVRPLNIQAIGHMSFWTNPCYVSDGVLGLVAHSKWGDIVRYSVLQPQGVECPEGTLFIQRASITIDNLPILNDYDNVFAG